MKKKDQIEVVNRMNISMFLLIFIFLIEITSGGVLDPLKSQISKHTNFLKILDIYNGKVATIFNIDTDIPVFVAERRIVEDGDVLQIYDNNVISDTNGVVVSISNTDSGSIVLIKSIDDSEYQYMDINTVSVTLYDYVSVGDIIGNGDGDYYKLKINNV